jgi:hypothetical protein
VRLRVWCGGPACLCEHLSELGLTEVGTIPSGDIGMDVQLPTPCFVVCPQCFGALQSFEDSTRGLHGMYASMVLIRHHPHSSHGSIYMPAGSSLCPSEALCVSQNFFIYGDLCLSVIGPCFKLLGSSLLRFPLVFLRSHVPLHAAIVSAQTPGSEATSISREP